MKLGVTRITAIRILKRNKLQEDTTRLYHISQSLNLFRQQRIYAAQIPQQTNGAHQEIIGNE